MALRASHHCEYCRAPEAIFNCAFEVEHVTPESLGGGDDMGNLALSCRVCNLRKSAHVMAIDPESNAEVALFNPRCDRFEDHFIFDQEPGRIMGLMAIGRATAVRLDMNSQAQTRARLQWMRLGIYP